MRWRKYRTVRELDKDNNRSLRGIQRLHHRPVADDMAASCATRHVPEGRSDPCGSLPVWPGVRRAGRPRQSPALTPGPAARAAGRLDLVRHDSATDRSGFCPGALAPAPPAASLVQPSPSTPSRWPAPVPWSPVVDELQPLVMRSCHFVPKLALNCAFGSQQFSSLHAVSGAHVPWMCPESMGRAHGSGLTTWMRTTGAYDDRTTSAASEGCLRSSMPAVACPCCCTELTLI